ncbi:riboflavin biosynthesis protein RibF [Akkermansiaceae bacterium]|nr:riboflavin biosynthesis protein RibF [Akkermansiaceae bacterium]MDA7888130.1 riboflavin biosynthesis protein RibF [Akkermansiaceae bacterium]
MQIYDSLAELKAAESDFGLALGVFDGIHLGHRAVLEAARGHSRTGVLTFEPHPVQVLAPDHAPRRILATMEHKVRILEELGVDFLVVIEFTKEFASGEARVFADELIGSGVKRLAAGEDWNFGKGRQGNMGKLAEWGTQAGVDVLSVSAVMQNGERISSTRIRQALRDENLVAAEEMLGRPYSVMGEVCQGRQLGRQLGFPTANVAVSDEQLPPNGVYVIEGRWEGAWVKGVANIGTRPTVDDSMARSLEVNLFAGEVPDFYGWILEVAFRRKIREERKFESVEALREQISRDVVEAKR